MNPQNYLEEQRAEFGSYIECMKAFVTVAVSNDEIIGVTI